MIKIYLKKHRHFWAYRFDSDKMFCLALPFDASDLRELYTFSGCFCMCNKMNDDRDTDTKIVTFLRLFWFIENSFCFILNVALIFLNAFLQFSLLTTMRACRWIFKNAIVGMDIDDWKLHQFSREKKFSCVCTVYRLKKEAAYRCQAHRKKRLLNSSKLIFICSGIFKYLKTNSILNNKNRDKLSTKRFTFNAILSHNG